MREDNIIHLDYIHNISVQENSQHQSYKRPDNAQHNVLTVHIHFNLIIIEAENLYGSYFPYTL